MSELAPETRDPFAFGPFVLAPRQRLLLKDGVPIELGARTLDTLIVLASRPCRCGRTRRRLA